MGVTMPTEHKNEVLCMKSDVHLKDVSPIDMKQTTERFVSTKV